MSLKDFLALTDDKLMSKFEETPPDTTKLRKAAIKKLDKAIEQYTATEPARGRKIYKTNNDVVELTLPFYVNLENTHYIPAERFVDALKALRHAVEIGETDEALIAAAGGETGEEKPKRARKSGGGSGWSESRREKFSATVAARKAAKQK